MPDARTFSFAVILLAAGRSSRMGRPKMLLPWGRTTVLGHLIHVWSELGPEQITVVIAPNDAGIEYELNRLSFPMANRIVNPDPSRGMFSSIQCAAQWTGWNASLTHWAFSLGDQPHLRQSTLRAVVDLSVQNPGMICQPTSAGHGRHPVLLPESYFKEVPYAKVASFKEFLESKAKEIMTVDVSDLGLDLDIDSPAEYEAALKLIES